MKQRGKLLAVITSCVLVLSSSSVVYSSAASDNIKTDVISEELREIMNNSDDSELIPVGIKLNDLDAVVIDKMIESISDYKVSDYLDIGTYSNGVMLDIIKETEEKYGFEKSHITPYKNPETGEITFESDIYFDFKSEKSKSLEEMSYDERSAYLISMVKESDRQELAKKITGMSLITKNISDDIDAYMAVRRECVTKAYKEYNHDFIDDYVEDEQIITNAGFAPYLIVNANKKQISEICENSDVYELTYSPELKCENEMYNALSITKASTTRDLYSSSCTGKFVRVGVLEAENGKYMGNYSMLSGCSDLYYSHFETDPGVENVHATEVTSIIKGKSVVAGGHTYRGVAPDSIVYQQCLSDSYSLTENIENLIERGVSIINFSVGYTYYDIYGNLAPGNSSYNDEDWLVDQAINNYGIVFVNSAGNSGDYIKSPGKAYNAITVGNCDTTTSSPYSMAYSSSFREDDDLANKPEIVAPGTQISFPPINSVASLSYNSGTSFSAPIVSGVAAQMIQCMPTLKLPSASQNAFGGKTYYNTVKALILLGANYQSISTTNNVSKTSGNISSSLYREKSGAGLLDAKKTIDIIRGNGYVLHIQNIDMSSNGTSPDGMNSYLSFRTGDKIRSVLCYSKIDRYRNLNLDLYIYNSNMAHQAYSTSTRNNVEIVEYEVPSSDGYLISADVYTSSGTVSNILGSNRMPGALVFYVER